VIASLKIKKEGVTGKVNNPEMVKKLRELFELVRKLGGSISSK